MATFNAGDVDYIAKLNALDNAVIARSRRNFIINGAMDIAQRGTSQGLTTSLAYGSLDRWCFLQQTAAAGNAAQINGSSQAGTLNLMRLQRTAASTGTGPISAVQIIEGIDAIRLQGQTVTLSWYAHPGANFSGSSMQMYAAFRTGTGMDEGGASMLAGSWTGNSLLLNETVTLTASTWVRYSKTFALASNIREAGVQFYYIPSGTAGAEDLVYITGVQLEIGSVASPFDIRPIGEELALCQRYYQIVNNNALHFVSGYATAGNYACPLHIVFPVAMRATPTITHTPGTTTNLSSISTSYVDARSYSMRGVATATGDAFWYVGTIYATAEL